MPLLPSYPYAEDYDFSPYASLSWSALELSFLNRFILGDRALDTEMLFTPIDEIARAALPEPMRSFYSTQVYFVSEHSDRGCSFPDLDAYIESAIAD